MCKKTYWVYKNFNFIIPKKPFINTTHPLNAYRWLYILLDNAENGIFLVRFTVVAFEYFYIVSTG